MNTTLPALADRLPRLATLPVIVGHAQKADLVWTDEQFRDLCLHMLNDNPDNFFLMPFRDPKTGQPKFAKAHKASARHRMQWAWDTVRGTASAKASVGFYPRNAQGESRWAAMDFDAHDGDDRRARDLALRAFDALFKHPELFLVLCTSGGGGWHLFVFTVDFHPVANWSLLLRNVANLIGTPIEKGLLEIFPDGESHGIGYGIRAPGTWNPKSDEFGLIAYERVTELLEHPALLGSAKESNTSLSVGEPPREKAQSSPNSGFSLYRGTRGDWRRAFAITAPRSRHGKLSKLVGTAFFQAGRNVARENARLQHTEAHPSAKTSLEEHLADFHSLWRYQERKWLCELSDSERRNFGALTTDTERDAFRIVRNWSRRAVSGDFKIHVESLALRIGLSPRGAGKLRTRFASLGIIRQTAPYVAHKWCARYQWCL